MKNPVQITLQNILGSTLRMAIWFATLIIAFPLYGESVADKLLANPHLAGNNLLAYPDSGLPQLSLPPAGYQPFHIEHYGRHGSRWLIGAADYQGPVTTLQMAAQRGCLTPEGATLLGLLEAVAADAAGNYGRLTKLGAEQHRGIARRMFANFPEVFAGEARVDARSTQVARCMLSMSNELVELAALNPSLRISMEAGDCLQPILNACEFDTVAIRIKNSTWPELQRYERLKLNPVSFAQRLISDIEFVADSVNVYDFFNRVFEIALNEQNHQRSDSLLHFFTPEEILEKWEASNARWYLQYGYAPQTGRRMPRMEQNLLDDILSHSLEAINDGQCSATLRFGHDTDLLPLACLLHLDGLDCEIADLDSIAERWQAYRMFPMAGNIQIVFYRNPADSYAPILVRVLLNEREARLPLTAFPSTATFYRWDDVKKMLVSDRAEEADSVSNR
jgi:hypothetical protein